MIHPKVARVFERMFGVVPGQLMPETSQETVEGWDSVSHIELVLALEEEFDMHFTTREFSRMTTVREILSLLESKGKL